MIVQWKSVSHALTVMSLAALLLSGTSASPALLSGVVPAAPKPGHHAPQRFVYIAGSGAEARVLQFRLGTAGRLTPLRPPSAPTGYSPDSIAVTPDGRFAYVTDETEATVSEYRIGPNGALRTLSAPRIRTGAMPISVVASPNGPFVYLANHGGTDFLCQYRIGKGGALVPLSPSTVATGDGPEDITFAPDGKTVYVTYDFGNHLTAYRPMPDGALVRAPDISKTLPPSDSPPLFAPHGFVYVHLPSSGRVAVCRLRVDGSMTRPIVAISRKTDMISLTPNGRCAYVAVNDPDIVGDLPHLRVLSHGILLRYQVRPDGTLAPMRPWPMSNSVLLENPVFSPAGRQAFFTYETTEPHNHEHYLIVSHVHSNGAIEPLRFPGGDIGSNAPVFAFLQRPLAGKGGRR